MAVEHRCKNFNHNRMNVSIRFCPDCGERLNSSANANCDDVKHAASRKNRSTFCCDCGKKLNLGAPHGQR